MHYDALAHFILIVCQNLDVAYPNQWKGRGGALALAATVPQIKSYGFLSLVTS